MSLFVFFFFWGNIWFVIYVSCIHHYIFTAIYPRIHSPPKIYSLPASIQWFLTPPSPFAFGNHCAVLCICLVWFVFLSVIYFVFSISSLLPQMSEIMQYLSFSIRLISLSLIPLRSIQLSQMAGFCLFMAEYYSIVSKYVCIFITSLSAHTLMGT